MYSLTGEYHLKVDTKGRARLPVGLLEALGESQVKFVINRGYEKHLSLYPMDAWQKKTNQMSQLDINIIKHRKAIRYFHRGAQEVTLDSADRILIPRNLLDYAEIDREAVIFTYMDQIEIWSKEKYEDVLGEEPEDFSQLAQEVFGGAIEGGGELS